MMRIEHLSMNFVIVISREFLIKGKKKSTSTDVEKPPESSVAVTASV